MDVNENLEERIKHFNPPKFSEPQRLHNFIITLPEELGIEKSGLMVEYFEKPTYYFASKSWDDIEIGFKCIFKEGDKVWHKDMKDSEIISIFEKFNDNADVNVIIFDETDANGEIVTRTKFTHPLVTSIKFDRYSYDNERIKGFKVKFYFEEVIEEENNGKDN